ncbi:MAG: AAA domain-containing protein, partial [Candidatus Latescibacteria bacterium]|nr:AAA domain-containing protein [Candidatus Latescibacterota bacterium]
IDEIDKIAASGTVMGPDVSRTGVQRTLLKLMEETEVDLQAPHDLASQMENALQFQKSGKIQKKKVNTRNILFIVSGAFQNIDDIIQRRMNQQQMGFIVAGDSESQAGDAEGAWLEHVKSEDLIQFGFESEFVGRLPVIASLHPLEADDLYGILRNPNSTVVQAKKRDFRAYGISVEFDDDALELIAQRAYEEKTGARGLVGVCEKILIPFEKKLPSTSIKRFRVTRQVVEEPRLALEKLLTEAAIARFEDRFMEEYNLTLILEPEARTALLTNAADQGVAADDLGMEMFKDYSHGLKLLQRSELTISRDAVENPAEYLNRLIKESYGHEDVAPESAEE